jgi:hypothetical protein
MTQPIPNKLLADFLRKVIKSQNARKVVTKNNQVFTIVAVSPNGIKAEKRGEDVLEDLRVGWN